MNLPPEPEYRNRLREAADLIRNHRNFFLTTHRNPDGDGLGCESALHAALTKLGKQVTVVNVHPLPETYRFLPASGLFQTKPREMEHFEVAVFLECPDLERSGMVLPVPGGADHILNIDHHAFNSRFGTVNLIDPSAAAAGEQIWDLLECLDFKVGEEEAVGLYTALATDTGNFRYASVTPQTHRIAAELLAAGVRPGEMNERLYEQTPPEVLKLLSAALARVRFSRDGRLGWFAVTRADVQVSGARENQTENFVNHVRAVKGVDVAVFFQEMNSGEIKISFRSRNRVDVAELARGLGGGGHARAAGVTLRGTLEVVQPRVLEAVEKKLAE